MHATCQPEVQNALRCIQQHHKLVNLVRSMAKELERLEEDNQQLRAAVQMYREVVRRTTASGAGAR